MRNKNLLHIIILLYGKVFLDSIEVTIDYLNTNQKFDWLHTHPYTAYSLIHITIWNELHLLRDMITIIPFSYSFPSSFLSRAFHSWSFCGDDIRCHIKYTVALPSQKRKSQSYLSHYFLFLCLIYDFFFLVSIGLYLFLYISRSRVYVSAWKKRKIVRPMRLVHLRTVDVVGPAIAKDNVWLFDTNVRYVISIY